MQLFGPGLSSSTKDAADTPLPQDVALLTHTTLSALLAGARIVLPDRFSAHAFWSLARAHAVTWYSAVPTIHQILLAPAASDNAPSRSGFRFVRSYCRSRLADFKVPKVIYLVTELPKDSTGKVQRFRLKQLLSK